MHSPAKIKTKAVFQRQTAALGGSGHPLENPVEQFSKRPGGGFRGISVIVSLRVDQFVGPQDRVFQTVPQQLRHVVRMMDPQQVLPRNFFAGGTPIPPILDRPQNGMGLQRRHGARGLGVVDGNLDAEIKKTEAVVGIKQDHGLLRDSGLGSPRLWNRRKKFGIP